MQKPKPTGRRKITPAISATMRASKTWGPETAVDKKRAVLAFNRATHLLALNAQAIELMNKLLSFSQGQDWSADSRPLVWPDNMRLVLECSFELSALRRNLRRLAEAGLISFRDSPKGQRYGKRDANEKIIMAATFGIDLSPLGLRVRELEALVEVDRARAVETRKLCRRFTCRRKMIASILDAAMDYEIAGPWCECADRLKIIIAARGRSCPLETLRDLCAALETLLERVQTAYAAVTEGVSRSRPEEQNGEDEAWDDSQDNDENDDKEDDQFMVAKTGPMGPTSDTLIQNTRQASIKPLYKEWPPAGAGQRQFADTGFAGENGFGKEPVESWRGRAAQKITAKPVDPATLLMLCPKLREIVWAPDGASWSGIIHTVEHVINTHLEIPTSTWKSAARVLGVERAAVAVALIYEKHEAGMVRCAGAYLNGMISRAAEGKLALSSSLFHWRDKCKNKTAPITHDPITPDSWN